MFIESVIYWVTIIMLSSPLNWILFGGFNKKRFNFIFISCCLPYLTMWGIPKSGNTMVNIIANPIYLALIMTVLEAIYLLTSKWVKFHTRNITLNILYLLTSLLAVILFTIYMPPIHNQTSDDLKRRATGTFHTFDNPITIETNQIH